MLYCARSSTPRLVARRASGCASAHRCRACSRIARPLVAHRQGDQGVGPRADDVGVVGIEPVDDRHGGVGARPRLVPLVEPNEHAGVDDLRPRRLRRGGQRGEQLQRPAADVEGLLVAAGELQQPHGVAAGQGGREQRVVAALGQIERPTAERDAPIRIAAGARHPRRPGGEPELGHAGDLLGLGHGRPELQRAARRAAALRRARRGARPPARPAPRRPARAAGRGPPPRGGRARPPRSPPRRAGRTAGRSGRAACCARRAAARCRWPRAAARAGTRRHRPRRPPARGGRRHRAGPAPARRRAARTRPRAARARPGARRPRPAAAPAGWPAAGPRSGPSTPRRARWATRRTRPRPAPPRRTRCPRCARRPGAPAHRTSCRWPGAGRGRACRPRRAGPDPAVRRRAAAPARTAPAAAGGAGADRRCGRWPARRAVAR